MSLKFTSTAISKEMHSTEFIISGTKLFAYYNTPEFPLEQEGNGSALNLLVLTHGRTQSAKQIKKLTEELIETYKGSVPLVIINFDHRNHGERTLDKLRNQDWEQGNVHHAHDMFSMIEGSVLDLKLIFEYLPSYYPKLASYKVTKILSGVSLGGHSTIRFAARYPGLVDAVIPIVGSYDVTTLLLNRLHDYKQNQLYLKSYNELKQEFSSDVDQERFPETLFLKSSHDDNQLQENFPVKDLKVLSIHGELDKIVFLEHSLPFFKKNDITVKNREYFEPKVHAFQAIKYPVGHEVTNEMIIDISQWLQFL